jgi:hypothetical protein
MMMNSFCAMANLKTFPQSPRCPDYLQPCAPIVEQCYGRDNCGTLLSDVHALDSGERLVADIEQPWPYDKRRLKPLESDVYNALVAISRSGRVSQHRDAIIHTRRIIRGVQYTDYKSGRKDCNIFFRAEEGVPLVPGRIRQIFSVPKKSQDGLVKECLLLAVQRYNSIDNPLDDPFQRFADFGAGLWSSSVGEVEIISPSDEFCHGILRQWDDATLVMRSLNRVSYFVDDTKRDLQVRLTGLLMEVVRRRTE